MLPKIEEEIQIEPELDFPHSYNNAGLKFWLWFCACIFNELLILKVWGGFILLVLPLLGICMWYGIFKLLYFTMTNVMGVPRVRGLETLAKLRAIFIIVIGGSFGFLGMFLGIPMIISNDDVFANAHVFVFMDFFKFSIPWTIAEAIILSRALKFSPVE